MYGWAETALIKARLRTAPVVDEEEPAEDPAITALREQLAQVNDQVDALTAKIGGMEHAEDLTVRRITTFPEALGELIEATNVRRTSATKRSATYVYMKGDIDWLEVEIPAYGNMLFVKPAGIVGESLPIDFLPNGNLSRLSVLAIKGYAASVAGNSAGTDDVWQALVRESLVPDEAAA